MLNAMYDNEALQYEKAKQLKIQKRDYILGVHSAPPSSKGKKVKSDIGGKPKNSKKYETYWLPGFSPRDKFLDKKVKAGAIITFLFKGVETVGMLDHVNESTFTVIIEGVKTLKAIRFDKFVSIIAA